MKNVYSEEGEKVISLSDWEEANKDVRQDMLDRTHDPQTRRNVAAIIDAYADKLFDALEIRGFIKKFQ